MREGPEARTRPRDRIVATACDLFHQHGIRSIGVDAIAEAAGTNKMTLYRHFGSKDDLIVECLRKVANDAEGIWPELDAAYPGDPPGQLRAWVRRAADCVIADGRGCDMVNAAIELTDPGHPARRVIEAFKASYWDRLTKLCAAAGATNGELLADTLSLLLEGARVSRQSMGAEGPSRRFVQMSEAIIETFTRGCETAQEAPASSGMVMPNSA
jgi:AcrR family transcriptional regulator